MNAAIIAAATVATTTSTIIASAATTAESREERGKADALAFLYRAATADVEGKIAGAATAAAQLDAEPDMALPSVIGEYLPRDAVALHRFNRSLTMSIEIAIEALESGRIPDLAVFAELAEKDYIS